MSLSIENLVKYYSNKKVVDNISFTVKRGSAYGILGMNGAGKTTLIKMILDIITKDSGQVMLNDRELDVIKTKVGYLAEERSLYSKKTVRNQLKYFAMLSGLKSRDADTKIDYWIEKFGLQNMDNRVLDTLSKGNKQKVQIISTIINDPNIIVFDEPFSGLDPINSEILRNIVIDFINRGKYILFCTHQMFYVEEFCDSISILKNGRQCIEGNLIEIKKSYGRNKLTIEIKGNLPNLNIYGVKSIRRNKKVYELDILNEDIANNILSILFQNKIKIFNFSLGYKSLHEIFIDVVGD